MQLMIYENLIYSSSPVQYWAKNNVSYRNIMNAENMVSIHLPVQYWKGLWGRNNNIS
jgi:hypothetical protein